MNPAHVHLMINHVPLFAALFGGALLVWGLLKNQPALRSAGLVLGVIGGLSGVIAAKSGERAEEIVEEYAGTNETALEAHEEAGEAAQWAAALLGLIALGGLLVPKGRVQLRRRTEWLAVLAFLIALGMVARAANLGGPIRHPEITDVSAGAVDTDDTEDEERHP